MTDQAVSLVGYSASNFAGSAWRIGARGTGESLVRGESVLWKNGDMTFLEKTPTQTVGIP
jgi:hypothetical protein